MKCDRARKLVSHALDRALPAGESDEHHRHLEDCPPCRTFAAELKESLLLLEELPTIEVDERFNAAVWARIRRDDRAVSLAARLREGLAEVVDRLDLSGAALKWSPLAIAAALLLMFGIFSGPLPGDQESSLADRRGDARIGDSAPPDEGRRPSDGLRAGEELASAGAGDFGTAGMTGVEGTVEEGRPYTLASDEETPGGIPAAVERYLLRNSRELRIDRDQDHDPERFRRANYSYPLRRVPDPSAFWSDFGIRPVTGGAPASASPPVLRPAGGPKPTVISF